MLALSEIDALVTKCECAEINSPRDYIDQLRSLVLLTKWEEPTVVRGLLAKARAHGYWDSLQLARALTTLISHLLGDHTDPIEVTSPLTETENHSLELAIPEPLLSAELALVSACLGTLPLVSWHSQLIDYHGAPFYGLWTEAQNANRDRLTYFHYLIFKTAHQITNDETWRALADSSHRNIPSYTPSSYERFIADLLLKKTIALADEPRTIPLLTHATPELSACFTPCGASTTLGAIHTKKVSIPALGPHFAPLGDTSTFGITRPASLGFPDVTLTKQSLSCWAPTSGGKSWMRFDCMTDPFTIEAKFIKEDANSLSFVFFAKADHITIGNCHLRPGSLDRYDDIAAPITLENSLTITPKHDGHMQVIPLAGGDHFWGATFLVAYPITSENIRYTWKIVTQS